MTQSFPSLMKDSPFTIYLKKKYITQRKIYHVCRFVYNKNMSIFINYIQRYIFWFSSQWLQL